MNSDRVERRFGVLVDMFWRHKSLHHGAVMRPGPHDEKNLRDMMRREEATFVEVKAALRWVFVDDASKHWATSLVDIAGFVNAYRTICDQLDGWLPGATAATPARPAGVAREGADHIAAEPHTPEGKAQAEARFAAMTREAPHLTVVAGITDHDEHDERVADLMKRIETRSNK